MIDPHADKEKRQAAGNSVVAAVALTGIKVVVGLTDRQPGHPGRGGPLGPGPGRGAGHLFAVRISGRPADANHPYGHGKVENLSALFETLLLLATCVWIIYEAVERLFFRAGRGRGHRLGVRRHGAFRSSSTSPARGSCTGSRKKHNSQALEADALHFSTDIWSSSVVILGLVCVKLGEWKPALAVLKSADAVAAVVVAIIVFFVCGELGMRTIRALIDTAPAGLEGRIAAAAQAVPGVSNCHQVRTRSSGPQLFVDVHVLVNGNQTLERAHALTEAVEEAIREVVPDADVTVHAEPEAMEGG